MLNEVDECLQKSLKVQGINLVPILIEKFKMSL